jgi:uncharacterized C2H2 Zn-finger protein
MRTPKCPNCGHVPDSDDEETHFDLRASATVPGGEDLDPYRCPKCDRTFREVSFA